MIVFDFNFLDLTNVRTAAFTSYAAFFVKKLVSLPNKFTYFGFGGTFDFEFEEPKRF